MFIINTFIFINKLLKISMYRSTPINIPININNLNSPLLNLKIEYRSINKVSIQKIISWIEVIKFEVLKLFLKILNISNKIPIIKPFNIKTKNM